MTKKHIIDPDILKACDIRGIVDHSFTGEDAYQLGRAFGSRLKRDGKMRCAIGRDGRHSSPELSMALERGLSETGIDVIDLGLVPTPLVYFAQQRLGVDGGVMVTASHNPPEYNGLKFVMGEKPFHGDDILDLSRMCRQGDFEYGSGTVTAVDSIADYIDYLHSFLDLPFKRDLDIVWDPGNGAVGAVLQPFLAGLSGKQTVICGEVDGDFPHHHPDPSLAENLQLLTETVVESGADLGIAFDGDGDRLGVVDSEGVALSGDELLVLFARDYLVTHPGEVVMTEVMAGSFFYDDVRSRGGKPLMWKVGHTNQKEKMLEEGIGLAGERSGHFFFRENGCYDDALFSAVKLLCFLGRDDKSITEMRRGFPERYESGEIRISLPLQERQRVLRTISDRLNESGRPFTSLDGIRVESDNGFWILRESNTQPHIGMRAEAESEEGLTQILDDLGHQLVLSGVPFEMNT